MKPSKGVADASFFQAVVSRIEGDLRCHTEECSPSLSGGRSPVSPPLWRQMWGSRPRELRPQFRTAWSFVPWPIQQRTHVPACVGYAIGT